MHDYDADIFHLGSSRLVQQPMYDQNAALVPPWNAPFVFVKGALVLVEAQLVVYHFLGEHFPSHVRVCFLPLLPLPNTYCSRSSIKSLPPALSFWTHPHCPTSGIGVPSSRGGELVLEAQCLIRYSVPKLQTLLRDLAYRTSQNQTGVAWFSYLFFFGGASVLFTTCLVFFYDIVATPM